jgi:hypothetical protein
VVDHLIANYLLIIHNFICTESVIYFELGELFALDYRSFGTLTLLCVLMSEVIKNLMTKNSEEETWSWEARDILLDTWTALLVVYFFMHNDML